ncbi:hypothetical protein [Lentibacillus sediminis]|uniref:hypothetical protein n=1 Tax=Lentibacillus sediminis TaxID=1940529 RepID=UPI000C1B9B56|nr:hypothetical protein [Lentibacillus sediminis]
MEKEDQILDILQQVKAQLEEHSKQFKSVDEKFESIDNQFKSIHEKLDINSVRIRENRDIITAVLAGQEKLKAEFDGMQISHQKEHASLKEENNDISDGLKLLKEENWNRKLEIQRVKNHIGIN